MLILKIVDQAAVATLDELTLPHLLVTGVVRVDFIRNENGCWADVYAPLLETYPVENAAYVMNESGKTISSFYV